MFALAAALIGLSSAIDFQSGRMDQIDAGHEDLWDATVAANTNAAGTGAMRAAATINTAAESIQSDVNGQIASMNNMMSTMVASMSTQMAQATAVANAAMSTQAATVASTMSTTTAQLQGTVSTAMATQSAAASTFQSAVSAKISAKTNCNAAGKFLNATTNQCVDFTTLVLSRMSGTSCSVTGQIRVNAATDRVEVCASGKWMAPVSVVSNSVQHSGDGCENCWINRQLGFTKRLAETYIRLLWTDVGRSHGWGSEWNRYHIRICDSGGGNCGDCQDPGHMRTTRHMNQWHGWWTDHYMPMASSGLCRRRNGSNMGAGNYRIRIWCDGGDNVVGWNGNSANIQVDEVYKA